MGENKVLDYVCFLVMMIIEYIVIYNSESYEYIFVEVRWGK